MSVLQLPEYIYTGMDSACKILDLQYKNVLIAADSGVSQNTDIIKILEAKAACCKIKVNTIICDSCLSFFDKVQEKLMEDPPEIIIVAGNGKAIDCISAISSITQIPFASIPMCAPTALWDSDCVDAFLNKKVPKICVLDPEMISSANSAGIAYEGLGMLTLSAESYLYAPDRYIKNLAKTAFLQIYDNLFSAFKGEISARENLLEAMYWAYLAYINSYEYSWESGCYRLCDFFEQFDIDALSILAVSCVGITETVYKDNENELINLSKELGTAKTNGADYCIECIRKLRAQMSVPMSVKNLGADERKFHELCKEAGEDDARLFSLVYYGDKKFHAIRF